MSQNISNNHSARLENAETVTSQTLDNQYWRKQLIESYSCFNFSRSSL